MVKTNKHKILIPNDIVFLHLEDMQNLHDQLLEDLRSSGIENKVLHAPCVKQAIEYCKSESIDFIISDWKLPDGTGYEFLQKVRSTKKYSKTPFLMVTTVNEVENIINAVSEGANEYLIKPWKRSELIKKINYCWENL